MSLASVVENLSVHQKFDVVIIDEASQAWFNGLIAIYFGKKVLIVGDDEQVTPDVVGQELKTIDQLIEQKLYDFEGKSLFNNQFSLYQLAKVNFGATQIMLTEHFRCVPEIISFSNELSYQGKVKPMREIMDSHLKPAWITHRVNGIADNKKNTIEAVEIVNLIRAMIAHPLYANKTIGVIAMVGNESDQVRIIQEQINSNIDEKERKERKILCGNAPNFQGDERDIMFLSVVDSPKIDSEGPISLRTDGAADLWKKRYNVAASRAKDQVWVIHSLNSKIDLKDGDLRKRLIEHQYDPNIINDKTDSEFERQVLLRLREKGYHVICQYPAGHYKIDLVVEGKHDRLAIECDGDRYHTIENLDEDLARQAVLERCGWKFSRIRGSEFFRNPEKSMLVIYEKLKQLNIHPNEKNELKSSNILLELKEWIKQNLVAKEDNPNSSNSPKASATMRKKSKSCSSDSKSRVMR